MHRRLHLYIDDSGSRRPDHRPAARTDQMDYFALGGILIFEDEVDDLIKVHKAFMAAWSLEYPLHSSRIRGHRGPFSWLRTQPDRAAAFLAELVSRFRRLYPFAARSFTSVGTKGTLASL